MKRSMPFQQTFKRHSCTHLPMHLAITKEPIKKKSVHLYAHAAKGLSTPCHFSSITQQPQASMIPISK